MHTAEKAEQLLRSHFEAIRQDPFLKQAYLIVIYEKNTGYESGHHWKIVEEYKPSHVVFQKNVDADKAIDTADQDPGIDSNFFLKNQYARVIGEALRKRIIYFYCNWVCANPWTKPYSTRRALAKKNLLSQLANCRLKLPAMDPARAQLGAATPRITWSGKIGPDGKPVHGQNDDLAMSLGQCLYWINRIYQMNYPGFPYNQIFPNIPNRQTIQTKH